MQWGQIKTLFILSFLILNVYLFIQFIDKLEETDLGILEEETSTIDERLEDENITYTELPEEQAQEPYISVNRKAFTEEEFSLFNDFKNQETVLIDKNFVVSLFDKPVPIPAKDSESVIEDFVKKTFIYPDEYVLWDWNKELNVLVFFQEKNERPIYFNQSGIILVFLNDKDEMLFYTQTMLGEADSLQDKKRLIKPMKAIEALYNARELRAKDNITQIHIGFHTRVPLADGVQVFVPAWKITVNDERNYFVNAIEGFVFTSNEFNFLKESIEYDVKRVETMKGKQDFKTRVLKLLNEQLEAIDRGEIE